MILISIQIHEIISEYTQEELHKLEEYVASWHKDGSNAEDIPFKETNNYVRKILRDYEIYKEICQ